MTLYALYIDAVCCPYLATGWVVGSPPPDLHWTCTVLHVGAALWCPPSGYVLSGRQACVTRCVCCGADCVWGVACHCCRWWLWTVVVWPCCTRASPCCRVTQSHTHCGCHIPRFGILPCAHVAVVYVKRYCTLYGSVVALPEHGVACVPTDT